MAGLIAGVGAALTAAGLIKSLVDSGGGGGSLDISGELSRIRGLFDQARTRALANVAEQTAQARSQTAANLAARGTYRAPVAENSFGLVTREGQRAAANVEGQIAGQEADALSGVLSSLLGVKVRQDELGMQRDAAVSGSLGGLGTALLLSGLNRTAPQSPAAGDMGGLGVLAPAASPSIYTAGGGGPQNIASMILAALRQR